MTICNKCKKDKDNKLFISKDKQLKTCMDCREQSKKWKEANKETVTLYNKTYNKNNSDKNSKLFIYAKKNNTNDEWVQYDSQLDAAKSLGLYPANINKVINGSLKSTGGYIFKTELENFQIEKKDWKEVKEENNIINKCKGQPSNHRILHETVNGIVGKKCCKCKTWKALTEYNKSKSHWDKLRNDCKNCLVQWRKDNKEVINKKYTIYEKKRKLTDAKFKLAKTLRSRLGNAIKRQNADKNNKTIELIGCSISFLKGYLEAKFKEGMSWENHGKWHIDHIKPCASFNLLDEEEQKKCFNYKNLQPLWATENLSKSCKFIDDIII